MEITFNELKEKEVINVADGKRMGRIEDVVFDKDDGKVLGVVLPGKKAVFKKREDVFIPIDELKRIGEDVILVKIYLNEPVPAQLSKVQSYNRIPKEVKKED